MNIDIKYVVQPIDIFGVELPIDITSIFDGREIYINSERLSAPFEQAMLIGLDELQRQQVAREVVEIKNRGLWPEEDSDVEKTRTT